MDQFSPLQVVRELLKRKASVDAATKKGNTALHIASLAGQVGDSLLFMTMRMDYPLHLFHFSL